MSSLQAHLAHLAASLPSMALAAARNLLPNPTNSTPPLACAPRRAPL